MSRGLDNLLSKKGSSLSLTTAAPREESRSTVHGSNLLACRSDEVEVPDHERCVVLAALSGPGPLAVVARDAAQEGTAVEACGRGDVGGCSCSGVAHCFSSEGLLNSSEPYHRGQAMEASNNSKLLGANQGGGRGGKGTTATNKNDNKNSSNKNNN